MEQAKAPKQLSGSMTAIVLGAFFRGPPIILVHMLERLYRETGLAGNHDPSRPACGRNQLARRNRALRPATSSRSLSGKSSTKESIASTITRHCARPVTAASAL